MRVLFLGPAWRGSCANACASSLERLGCGVIHLPPFERGGNSLTGRIIRRIVGPVADKDYNRQILSTAEQFRPDFILAFKGASVTSATLQTLELKGFRLYNYYPDRVLTESRTNLGRSLSSYHCVFDTKQTWDGDAARTLTLRCRKYLPHGYDPDVHRQVTLTKRDIEQYGCDVSLIANHSPRKAALLSKLVDIAPELNLKIWGGNWWNCSKLKPYVQGYVLTGDQYARAIQASRINLGIMGVTEEVRDFTTTRTYEIPACGGFMLHERNPEALELYEEDKEMACFGSVEDLAHKISYYIVNKAERERIALAGHKRCVPAYSYDNRMRQIICWHETHSVE